MNTTRMFLVVLLAMAGARAEDVAGREIAPWQRGMLDIHQISTGRGNAALFILPDGTTLLVDAGELPVKTARHTPDRPDSTRPGGERITRYIRHALRHDPQPALDYVILTHFHDDHIGGVSSGSPSSRSGAYKLAGVAMVGEHIRIGTLLDRGWPSYSYPAPIESAAMQNYRAFVRWQAENNGMAVERFTPGRNDQVVLRRDRKSYPTFEFRNVGANGEVWTGVGAETRHHFPPVENVPRADWPSENMCSISFRLSYGKFDFYSGGDIPGVVSPGYPEWQDVETPVAKAVGPVDAAILNHHGYIDSQNAFFIAALRPRVWLLSVWDSGHPTSAVWHRLMSTRLYPGPREVFATDLHPGVRQVISRIEKMASDGGHIVVRVSPGGGDYRVVVVDHSSESHQVKKVFGPYPAR